MTFWRVIFLAVFLEAGVSVYFLAQSHLEAQPVVSAIVQQPEPEKQQQATTTERTCHYVTLFTGDTVERCTTTQSTWVPVR